MIVEFIRIVKHIRAKKFQRAIWWSKWAFGYYNESWYSGLFPQTVSCKECGEITPSYSILENCDVARIKALNADMKIIFLIRNPIERAWSAIRFNVDRGFSKINLDSADEIVAALKAPGMILRGDYERTLHIYLEHFDSSQILFCFYDAIKHDPKGLGSDITTFLDVAPFKENAIDNEKLFNSAPARNMPLIVMDYLHETCMPMVNRIAGTFGSYATMWGETKNICSIEAQKEYPNTQLLPTIHP